MHACSLRPGGPALPFRSPATTRTTRRSAARSAAGPRSALAEPPATPFASDASHLSAWAPDSWRARTAHQQPNWRDQGELEGAKAEIARMPPLVFAGECRTLQARLAACATGEAFMLQGEGVDSTRRGLSDEMWLRGVWEGRARCGGEATRGGGVPRPLLALRRTVGAQRRRALPLSPPRTPTFFTLAV